MASASVSLSLDLRAFQEGLKAALRMGQEFGKNFNQLLIGKARIDVSGIDKALADYEAKIANLDADLPMDTAQAEGGLERVKKKVQEVEKQHTISVKGIRDQLAMWGLAMSAVERGFAMVKKVATLAFAPAAEVELIKQRLVGLYQSTERAEQAFAKFEEVAKKTPSTLQQVVEAGATLKAFGLDAESTIRSVTDLAAYMGMDLVEAASAVGRSFAGGVGASEIMRERGVLALIKSFEGIEDLTKLTLPEFREVMLETLRDPAAGIAGAADRMSQSLVGSLSNVEDELYRVRAEIGAEFTPVLIDMMKAIIEVVKWWGNSSNAVRVLLVVLPIMTAAWYKLMAAQTTYTTATAALTGALSAAGTAVQAFFGKIGPVGWALIAATAAVTAFSIASAAAKKETDELADATSQMTSVGREQVTNYDVLVGRLKALRTASEGSISAKRELKRVAGELNENYGEWIGKINLESDAWDKVAESLVTARERLIQYQISQALDETYKAQLGRVVQLRMQLQSLTGEGLSLEEKIRRGMMTPPDERLLGGAGDYYAHQADMIARVRGELQQAEAALIEAQRRASAAAAGLAQTTGDDNGGGGGASGGGTSAETVRKDIDSIRELLADYMLSDLQRLNARHDNMVAEIREYYAQWVGEAASGEDGLTAVQVEKLRERESLITQASVWRAFQEAELAKKSLRELELVGDERLRNVESYYGELKFRDNGYYAWKQQRIRDEVSLIDGLSEEQKSSLIDLRLGELEKERLAWDRMPLDAVIERYKNFKSEMSDTRNMGVAEWSVMVDGLRELREQLEQFSVTEYPDLAKILAGLDSEINIAQMNAAGKNGNWFWNSLLGFDASNEDDNKRVAAIKGSLSNIYSAYESLNSSLAQLNNERRESELAALEERAEKERWSNREIEKARAGLNAKFDKEDRKLRKRQQRSAFVMSIVNTAEAVTKALSAGGITGLILAGITGVMGAYQTALIAKQAFRGGGHTGDGPRDEVAGVVHRGEIVFEKPIVEKQKGALLTLRRMMQNGFDLSAMLPGVNLQYAPVPVVSSGKVGYSGGGYTDDAGAFREAVSSAVRETLSLGLVARIDWDRKKLYLETEKGRRQIRGY